MMRAGATIGKGINMRILPQALGKKSSTGHLAQTAYSVAVDAQGDRTFLRLTHKSGPQKFKQDVFKMGYRAGQESLPCFVRLCMRPRP